ncbi:uncharacterized protein LOC135697090 [Ochlerotatus camptorhynchus]|uniref:uncharacterized protein LOC135697090 n=1 Tax=Ochlerotatus camptorhynchus TaxID=644619 RepID=UPI0031CF378D
MDKDAAIVLDKIAIQPGSNYCSNLKKYVGPVTLSGNGELANHLLVFMLVFLRSQWKQVVGYHFTGDSIKNGGIKSILFELINRAEAIGLQVHAVINDCGGANKKLWNDIGVKHSRERVMMNTPIPHPSDPTRTLEIVPDSVHVFKSMIHGWIKKRTIELPEAVVQKHALSGSTADITHLTELVAYEAHCDLKMACGLTEDDVNFSKPHSNFDKMKVKMLRNTLIILWYQHCNASVLRVGGKSF